MISRAIMLLEMETMRMVDKTMMNGRKALIVLIFLIIRLTSIFMTPMRLKCAGIEIMISVNFIKNASRRLEYVMKKKNKKGHWNQKEQLTDNRLVNALLISNMKLLII